jgi:hypothetical protein
MAQSACELGLVLRIRPTGYRLVGTSKATIGKKSPILKALRKKEKSKNN